MTDRVPGAARRTRWRAAALALTVLGLACVVIWSDRPAAPSEAASAPTTGDTAAATPSAPASSPAPEVEPALPVRLSIPAMRLSTRLITLGLQPDKSVEVPRDPARAGWFRRGPTPGSVGSSVILGHVDSVDGPAVFFGLAALKAGARVTVGLDDGSEVTFEVRSVTTYANEAFPARKVYGSHGRRELNLVTCGGAYDAARGGYQSNVVVNARMVSAEPGP
jgi:sortase (surface protein transpeptidase)